MTRINANIKPGDLCDEHLLAEYREIIRIPNVVRKNITYNLNRKLPTEFKLGNGHVLYFYDKIKFLHNRFNNLKQELNFRGYETTIDDSMFLYDDLKPFYNDADLTGGNAIICERIIERVQGMKHIKFNKKITTKDQYIFYIKNKYLK